MKKLKLTIVLMSILLVSIFVGSSFEIFDSIAAETGTAQLTYSLTHTAGSGLPVREHISGPTKPSITYTPITEFPISGVIFNKSKYYFCVQHGVAYGGQKIDNYLGDTDYHVDTNKATANKHGGYLAAGYTDDMTADVPSSSTHFYVDTEGTLHEKETINYYGYREHDESPIDYVYTNWLYLSEDISFSCEDTGKDADEKAGLAFLFACYMSEGENNQYVRGTYQADPLQFAVWSSFLNEGAKEDNPMQDQADAFVKYHKESDNPNVNAKPDANVGTVLSGTNYVVGPFEMYKYVRAEDYDSPKVNTTTDDSSDETEDESDEIVYDENGDPIIDADSVGMGTVGNSGEQSLQAAFGTGADVQGTIIKAEAVVTNANGDEKEISFPVPKPTEKFNINLPETELDGYDELKSLVFTYQRIHAYAEGKKYNGIQYRLKFSQASFSQSEDCKYDCQDDTGSGNCEFNKDPGSWDEPYDDTCEHTWYEGCYDTYCDGKDCTYSYSKGCSGGDCEDYDCDDDCPDDCDGDHGSYCPGNCIDVYTCPGDCTHVHGEEKSYTHSDPYLCEHKHEDCKKFLWKYDGTAGDVAQDGYAGGGALTNEIVKYTVRVDIPLKTDMTIYKYITDVEHIGVGDEKGTDISVPSREDMSYDEKKTNTVKIERGDKVTYKIILDNDSRFPTTALVRDILPEKISSWSVPDKFEYSIPNGGTHTAGDITVPAGESLEFEVTVVANATTGTYENKVEYISNNAGEKYFRFSEWGKDATHGVRKDGNIVNIAKDHQFDGDFYTIKEYDVTVDKYIRKVNHKTNGYATFDSTDRMKAATDDAKQSNPVYAEFGDVVTYHIDIYNTCEEFMTADNKDREGSPYWSPDLAYVDIEDTLPIEYDQLKVTVDGAEVTPTVTDGKFTLTGVKVPAGGKVSVVVTLVVEEVTKETVEVNTAKISGSVRNVNGLAVNNNSKKTISKDWYKIQDYNLSMNKYVSKLESEMTEFNNNNKFTNEINNLSDKRSEMNDEQKAYGPVHVEKTDIVTYTIIAKNDATGSGLKYATQVRPSEIKDRMDDGLTFVSVKAQLKNSNGDVEVDNVGVTHTTEGANTHIFGIPEMIGNEYLILDPGDYMEYTVVVEVTKTNMYLFNLSNTASIETLTNINSVSASRIVTTENIASQKDSTEFVKLKDLVIAGKVWLDTDEDGYMGIGKSGELNGTLKMSDKPSIDQDDNIEYAMQGILVKLYEVGKEDEPIRTTRTDDNGLFTFSRAEDLVYYAGEYNSYPDEGEERKVKEIESQQRLPKAKKDAYGDYTSDKKEDYISYYIEYEYDGLVYRSTEEYSYKNNLTDKGEFNGSPNANGQYLYNIDSNAFEFDKVRQEFNEHYAVMSYNQAADFSDLTDTSVLEFEKKGHESFIRENPERVITARSFIITANQTTDYLWLYPLTKESSYPETEYLKYINLGLEERDKLDLELTKDLIDVDLSVNGDTLTYEYGKVTDGMLYFRGTESETSIDEDTYTLYLYKTDYFYRYEMYEHEDVRKNKGEKYNDTNDVKSELRLDLHYQIKVSNKSLEDELVRVYEVVDYNTASMQLRKATVRRAEDDPSTGTNVVFEATSKYNDVSKYGFDGEKQAIYRLDDALNPEIVRDPSDPSKIISTNVKKTELDSKPYEVNFLHGMEGILLAKDQSLIIDLTYTVDKYKPDLKYALTEKIGEGDIITAAPDARSLFVDDKYNVAQIGAYAAFEMVEDTKNGGTKEIPKGLVDNDSNAANINSDCVNINDLANYEDNAFRIKLQFDIKADERNVSGFVFEDTRTDKLDRYNYFAGNGIFDSSDGRHGDIKNMKVDMFKMALDANQDLLKDTKLSGMTVELVEIVTVDGKDYEETIDPLDYIDKTNIIVQTEGEGKYVLDSFLPGTYIVRFRYGDLFKKLGVETMSMNSLLHNGQDYKSTSYVLTETDDEDDLLESTTENTYTDYNQVKLAALAKENYSDARDNEYRRLEIMSNSEIMDHDMAEFLKYTNYDGSVATSGIGPFEAVDDGAAAAALTGDMSGIEPTLSAIIPASEVTVSENLKGFVAATNGFADTVTFTLDIEDRNETVDKKGNDLENGKIAPDLVLGVPNIDYGVVFRPENFVEMTKKIKNIKLTTLSGEVLIDLEYEYENAEDREGEIVRKVGIQNVQSVNTTNGIQGFRYINIDEELIQGATLSVEYLMTVNNIGEVDLIAQKLIDMGNVIDSNPQNLFTTTNVVKKLDAKRTDLNGKLLDINGDDNGIRVNYYRAPKMINSVVTTDTYKYGMFVGNVYYKGLAGETDDPKDIVAPLKVSKILDFIDNDATFVQANNSETNKFWTITTETELLRDGLIGESGLDTTKIYLDNLDRKYVTNEKNNLVYSVGTLKENPELLKDIYPQYIEKIDSTELNHEADIIIQLDAVLGGDKESEDMVYDNVAEIIEFITVTGRRTNFASTVGNIVLNGEVEPFESSQVEVDSDGTEVIMLTPPTGRTQFNLAFDKVKYIVALVAAVVVLIVLVYITKFSLHGKVGKSKFYK